MKARALLKRLVRRAGYDIIRFGPRTSPVARRMRLFRFHGINLVFDVGASSGGYARELRNTGYRGRIVSFEPLAAPFAQLLARSRGDTAWDAVQTGLGREPGLRQLNVAANSESSSFLEMDPRHAAAYPGAAYVGIETVTVARLDDVFGDHCRAGERAFVKIDAQGYEMRILEGAAASLPAIRGIQVEMSLVPMYAGEARMTDLVTFLEKRGFVLMSVQPVVEDPASGQLLQIDGLFFRSGNRP